MKKIYYSMFMILLLNLLIAQDIPSSYDLRECYVPLNPLTEIQITQIFEESASIKNLLNFVLSQDRVDIAIRTRESNIYVDNAELKKQVFRTIPSKKIGQNDSLECRLYFQSTFRMRMHATIPSIYVEEDTKYPHQCFECNSQLMYGHAMEKARKEGFTQEQFKEMWKSEYVEFYCCHCFQKLRMKRINEAQTSNQQKIQTI